MGVCDVGVCWGYGSVVGVVWCGKVFGGGGVGCVCGWVCVWGCVVGCVMGCVVDVWWECVVGGCVVRVCVGVVWWVCVWHGLCGGGCVVGCGGGWGMGVWRGLCGAGRVCHQILPLQTKFGANLTAITQVITKFHFFHEIFI